jgi:toxin CcdB
MAQFDVYSNMNQNTRNIYPYIMDVQSSLLEALDTRLVIPLIPKAQLSERPINNLIPCIVVNKKEYYVLTPQLAAINKRNLGKIVENCKSERNAIVSSIDFLITGFQVLSG